jgi:hypothetical protein
MLLGNKEMTSGISDTKENGEENEIRSLRLT